MFVQVRLTLFLLWLDCTTNAIWWKLYCHDDNDVEYTDNGDENGEQSDENGEHSSSNTMTMGMNGEYNSNDEEENGKNLTT